MEGSPYAKTLQIPERRPRPGTRSWLPRAAAALAIVAAACALAWPKGARVEARLEAPERASVVAAASDVTLTETVDAEGLPADSCVDVRIELRVLGRDGTDEGPATFGGRPVSAHASVRADHLPTEVPLTVDATGLEGDTLVARVVVESGGRTLLSGDADADDQSVRVAGVTVAAATPAAGAIRARVSYRNLEPGTAYDLAVRLVELGSVSPLPHATPHASRLVPASPDGAIDVTLPLDASSLAGRDVRVEATVSWKGRVVAACSGEDAPAVGVATIAPAVAPARCVLEGDALVVRRTLAYAGLVAGATYTVRTSATVAGGDGPAAEGEAMGFESSFVAEGPSGEVTLAHAIGDASTATRSVDLEDVLVTDGAVVARGAGLTVRVASMEAATAGAHTGIACEPTSPEAQIRDVVACEGLEPGAGYLVTGTLRAEDANGRDLGALTDAQGEPVGAVCALTAQDDGTGSAELTYDLDATTLAGGVLRATETLSLDGSVVARATGDAVRLPTLAARASGPAAASHEADASGREAVVVDVDYGNLPDGADLACVCELVDARTGRPVVAPDGTAASARISIVGTSGTGTLSIPVDASALAGSSVVALTRVEAADVAIAAASTDWDDPARVSFPSVEATLTEAATGSHVAPSDGTARLLAEVSADALERDAANAVRLSLVDADTGEPVRDASGREAAAVVPLETGATTAGASAAFDIDAASIAGRTVALRATLERDGGATAASEASGASRVRVPVAAIERRGDATYHVTCENVEPGREYRVALVDDASRSHAPLAEATAWADADAIEVDLRADVRDAMAREVHAEVSLDGTAIATARLEREPAPAEGVTACDSSAVDVAPDGASTAPDGACGPEGASREAEGTPMGLPLQLLAFAAIAATVTGALAALAARRAEDD